PPEVGGDSIRRPGGDRRRTPVPERDVTQPSHRRPERERRTWGEGGGKSLPRCDLRRPAAPGRERARGDRELRGGHCPSSNGDGLKRGSHCPTSSGDELKRGSHCPTSSDDELKRGSHCPTSSDDGLKRGGHCPTSNGDGVKRGSHCPTSNGDELKR